ncbi:MAG: hypothetical protein E7358_01365 [Clostridiales bacterium]|nr:hypothetical protein [Clostridiales bacterium]
MVKAICEYNDEKIKKMMKPLKVKAYVTAFLFSAVFLAMGAISVIGALKDGINWVTLILGGVVCLGAIYPPISTYLTQKKNYKASYEAMQLHKGDLVLEMVFKEKRLEVTTSQGDEVQNETVLLRNVTSVRANKEGVAIYIGEDMYFIYNDDIDFGSREELLRIFERIGTQIKGK